VFEPIKKIVAISLGQPGENARRVAAAIVLDKATPALEQLLGEAAVGKLEAVVFRGGRLTVKTVHPVWAEELRLRQAEAIRAVNQALGEPLVKSLLIRRA
jgi:hypothetical protein